MSKIAGVHHICLKTAGRPAWEAAIAFYTQVLGCPVVRSWGEGDGSGAMLDLGNCLLEVFADADEPLAPGVHRHVAFRTDDVDGVVELVRQRGHDGAGGQGAGGGLSHPRGVLPRPGGGVHRILPGAVSGQRVGARLAKSPYILRLTTGSFSHIIVLLKP